MSLQNTINYDTSGNFDFDSDKVEFDAGLAKLKLSGNTGQHYAEDFADDTGFTYDSAKAEFVGGVVRQKDQTSSNQRLGATFATLDASWNKDGALTATLRGTPTLVGGKLQCFGSHGVRYAQVTSQIGAYKFKYTPNYSGASPASYNVFMSTTTGNNDRIGLTTSVAGTFRVWLYNNVGASIYAATAIGAAWLPTAGQEYEFEINYSATGGFINILIDGVLHGTLNPGAWARSTGVTTNFDIGASAVVYADANASFDDILVFNTVQHTVGYVAGYSVPLNLYAESKIDLPQFVYGGIASVISYDAFTTVEVGGPRYIVNGQYWTGSAWASSAGTYAQSSPKADMVANLASLAVIDNVDMSIVFPDGSTRLSVDNVDVEYTDQQYDTTDPTVEVNAATHADGLLGFAATIVEAGSDTLTFYLLINDVAKYWNGSAWATSDKSLAQSNTAAEVEANKAALDISDGVELRVGVILHSADGSTTPSISQAVVSYDFFAALPDAPGECIVYAHIRDLLGDVEDNAFSIIIENKNAVLHGAVLVRPQVLTVTMDDSGRCEASVIETATVGVKYLFKYTYTNVEGEVKTKRLGYAEVPDQASVNVAALTFSDTP